MKTREEFLTFCHMCPGRCSRKAVVEGGKIVEWERDLESGLPTEFCPTTKGKSVIEICAHPDRLKYPQKRAGAKGEGKWQRITWDEALDTIANKLKEIKEKYGPEAVAMCLGEPKGMEYAFGQRFASYFGTPNVATPGNYCGIPLQLGAAYTMGNALLPDDEVIPRLVVFWGINALDSSAGIRRESVRAALIEGAKFVVIDPKRIDIAKRADIWIKLRPQSDGPLAMGLIKVVIEEKLYDEEFVTNWTVGFDQLREHVETFTLDDVERVTWVPKQQIQQFARLYAQSKPAQMQLGNALEQGINCIQMVRAINILRAICGHVNVPGGDIFLTPASWTRPGRFFLPKEFPRKAEERAIGNEFKLAMRSAYIAPQSLVKAILEEKPYPVKAALAILTDPLVSYPDTEATYKAFMKLDLFVISELFPTPSTAVADIVLPAAWGAEHDSVGYWPGWYQEIRAYPKLVDPPGEAWPDHKWISELAERLGLGQYFWKSETEVMDYMLEPAGVTWEEFKKIRILKAKREYKKPEEGVFKTPSGKVEIYSKQLEEMGYSPMPTWEELCHFREDISDEYPLLLTNRKEEAYMLTGYKHVAYSRKIKPEPTVELNPETARKAGLEEGDMVYIETKKGRIKQKLEIDPDLDPRVVFASFGWWFPEEGEKKDFFEFRKANINLLIDSEPPYDNLVGSVELRGVPCKVYKAQ